MTEDFATPYLDAIQMIPGDTASSKKSWIARLALEDSKASGDINQVPGLMRPLARVEIAIQKKYHEDITWALKNEDSMIVKRAFKATWYFDGSHKDTVSAQYFNKNVFSHVSLNTRLKIIRTLAYKLYGKDSLFAKELYNLVVSIFNVQQAIPLLLACDEEFAYQQIATKSILLSQSILKKFYSKNPDFVVRYLRLGIRKNDEYLPIKINVYQYILPKLVKKRLQTFVELYEALQPEPAVRSVLSNTLCDVLLKKGMDYIVKKPYLYIDMIPLKRIRSHQMEIIFPNLLPKISDYSTDSIISYLQYYPEEKKLNLLFESYRKKYGVEFLEKSSNVTSDIIQLLPTKERIKQVNIKCSKNASYNIKLHLMNYEEIWRCYLPTSTSLSIIKADMKTVTTMEERAGLLLQMIYSCKVNKDEIALVSCLEYILERHKNEEFWLLNRVMDCILDLYDAPLLCLEIWLVLQNIPRLIYIKYGYATADMLIALAYHQLSIGMPIKETIEMWLNSMIKRTYINFHHKYTDNSKYLEYEAKCLATCINIIEEKYDCAAWKNYKTELTFELFTMMYNFHERCSNFHNRQYQMSIKDYPWLLKILHYIASKDNNRLNSILLIFKKHESTLYYEWCLEFEKDENINIVSVQSRAAFNLLKQNPKSIENFWFQYLNKCKDHCYESNVQHFIREMRWYKSTPYLFLTYCLYHYKEDMNYLVILAILLETEIVMKLIKPLIPTQTLVDASKDDAKNTYDRANFLPIIMKVCNPPLPLDFLEKLCEGDYLSIALRAMMNAIRQYSLPKVLSFAEILAQKRVSVQKHSIRIMFTVAPMQQLKDFILTMWQQKQHPSIREVLAETAQYVFNDDPNNISWSLLSAVMSTIISSDVIWLPKIIERQLSVLNEYKTKYIKLLFDMIDILETEGAKMDIISTCLSSVLYKVTGPICDLLTDEFTEGIIRKYLFHQNNNISSSTINFTICSYLLLSSPYRYKRMETFANIFVTQVKAGWNVKGEPSVFSLNDPSSLYPVNHTVNKFIHEFVNTFFRGDKVNDSWAISKMLEIFLSVLKPQMDANSYLMLMFANKFNRNESPKTYGLKIGKILPELVNTFSSECTSYIYTVFAQNVLQQTLFSENVTCENIDFLQGLIEADNVPSCFMAANIVVLNRRVTSHYHELVKKLLRKDHPSIQSIICNYLNEMTISNFDDPIESIPNHFDLSDETSKC